MPHLEKTEIELGYIPLLDCIAILWAKHRGYFEQQGLQVNLVKEVSWASLRDRLAFGLLDAAHCLSAMLPAALAGSDQVGIPFQTSIILSRNCANISLSQKLCYDLNISKIDTPQQSAHKLFTAIESGQLIRLAHVFPYSIHHYCLREWLALADINTARKIKLATFPPPYMVEAISNHSIDGFCVGEPWNIQGELLGVSQIVTSSQDVIPKVADKVLAFSAEWALQYPNTLNAITVAIQRAQDELQTLTDYSDVWQLLVDFNIVQFNCSETVHTQQYHHIQNIIRNFIQDSALPTQDDFVWLIGQMQKWDQLHQPVSDEQALAKQCIYPIGNI
ncbi:ABC transporter substrate-binding protein [Acinetobacter puyangensis]|uniref:NitT/TauT family transport system ATP-binding protein n=1 Tax=Acinetobacter puyangensis TaxID=1096779 RepID=A0A240EBV4_9GAMM|nr:ABC transporter substrate-binding protein [Acinetobacter puyangensis]SNX45743.1 NitT/TauT family transport system ATP-binding protein [Acinetobacter puyangensis]